MKNISAKALTYCALFMALTAAVTIISGNFLRTPIGYIHIGDSMIFLAVLLLGTKKGAVSGALGSALSDLLLFPSWAVPTFIIKLLMALIFGICAEKIKGKILRLIIGFILSGIIIVLGYFAAGMIIFGFKAAWAEIPLTLVQLLANTIVTLVLYPTLKKALKIKL